MVNLALVFYVLFAFMHSNYIHYDVLKFKKKAYLYEIFTLHSVYGYLSIWSFECEIVKWNWMTRDKTKQLLHIFNWQALVVCGQDFDKMDAIFQCWEIFYKFECSCKDCVGRFNFCAD